MRTAGEDRQDCWASLRLEWNESVGGGGPGLRVPERASCTQLVATRAQMFPEGKGSAVPEPTVREIGSVGACVSKLLTASQVAQSVWLGYRYGTAEFRVSPFHPHAPGKRVLLQHL